ncbi:MAG: cyclic nucleotide-binding domain-containing protein [Planctomycetaceae bacterium]
MPAEVLGRSTIHRKGFLDAIRQLWRRPRDPEVRARTEDIDGSQTRSKGSGEETRIYLQDVPAVLAKYKTTRVQAVEFFGEQSALGRIERTATVFADSGCELLEIRWQGLRDIMQKDPALKERIDQRFRDYGLRSFLRNSPYFAHLYTSGDEQSERGHSRNRERRRRLLKEAQFESYGEYDKVDSFKKLAEFGSSTGLKHEPIIAHEGDYPNGVILIRSGIARVSRQFHNGHRTISYLTPGQAFGIQEIVEGWKKGNPVPLQHSLRAVGYVTVVIIPTRLFEEAILLEASIADEADAAPPIDLSAAPQSSAGKDVDAGLLEFLVERRFVNGTATMVIDMDRCTRCDDCVRACAATHDNNPRFLRHGPMHGKYMVANACMHCADPVCMIRCPTGAIHRNVLEGQVVINDETCIGCQACAMNCPYDAIRMVQIRDTRGFLFHDARHETIDKATKCDLCADQLTGPACQNACPHDALARLNLGEYESVADWVNR